MREMLLLGRPFTLRVGVEGVAIVSSYVSDSRALTAPVGNELDRLKGWLTESFWRLVRELDDWALDVFKKISLRNSSGESLSFGLSLSLTTERANKL